MELLDVYDATGAPTGVWAPRSEVHQKGLWHATVHIYVYRLVGNRTQVLAHLRSAKKDLYPNTWDPVLGGHIKSGKTPVETAIEELDEEIGLSVSVADLVVGPILKADKGLDKEWNHLFACKLPYGATIQFKDKEVQKVRWVELDEISRAIQITPTEWRPTFEEFSIAYASVLPLLSRDVDSHR